MESRKIKKLKTLTVESTEDDHSEFTQIALSNTVVLREIFKFLPVSTLKSCNLVNKLWKNECYSYFRDKLKWVAKISVDSPCASLRDFNELIGSTTVVPYNGLILHIDQNRSNFSCQCNGPEDVFTNVLDKLSWKHLDIFIDLKESLDRRKPKSCGAITLGLALLEQKIAGLESLELRLDDELQGHFHSNWPPALWNLRTICFPPDSERHGLWSTVSTSFVSRLTYKAPNLQEIKGLIGCGSLQCFPKDKWRYVKEFLYCYNSKADERQIISQFVSERPSLRTLSLRFAPNVSNVTKDLTYKSLFELSRMTIEDFEIQSPEGYNYDVIERLDVYLPFDLPKLRVLRLHMTSGFRVATDTAVFLNESHSVRLPLLQEFHFSVDSVNGDIFGHILPGPEIRDENDRTELHLFRFPLQQPYESVSKLRLELDPGSSSFVQLHRMFPAVTDMRIVCRCYDRPSRLPYKQIFRLWRNLEYFSAEIQYLICPNDLDAAFCGLHAKEVALLSKEDDNFLMTVQLVPTAPCVLTMRNLKSFIIEYPHGVGESRNGTNMTRVTRVLTRRYLPKAMVKAPCHM